MSVGPILAREFPRTLPCVARLLVEPRPLTRTREASR